ncbi:unnamed protein product [Rotaria sp. Silwood2]|nr:unnamed protein product [Rotaria sp. Silwood2]CAF2893378.1 unnamed protein product [Rotaria sp. Silwood2]CAF3078613.1 unnamed protein product [Rotaria sp. Silwood2]CAF3293431.1 unnamed protein product [Rotaria sp. Silwood2]CAF4040205.1 unnamed protein product [Rotaria sp. Silwood2]
MSSRSAKRKLSSDDDSNAQSTSSSPKVYSSNVSHIIETSSDWSSNSELKDRHYFADSPMSTLYSSTLSDLLPSSSSSSDEESTDGSSIYVAGTIILSSNSSPDQISTSVSLNDNLDGDKDILQDFLTQ